MIKRVRVCDFLASTFRMLFIYVKVELTRFVFDMPREYPYICESSGVILFPKLMNFAYIW